MDFLKKILGVDYHPCQGFWLYTHWLYPLKKVEVKLKEWLHRKLFPWCLVTGRWPASVWPSLILCYARVQLLVSLDFNVSTLFHCLVLNKTVSNEQQKWLQGCTSDKVHENGHNLRHQASVLIKVISTRKVFFFFFVATFTQWNSGL